MLEEMARPGGGAGETGVEKLNQISVSLLGCCVSSRRHRLFFGRRAAGYFEFHSPASHLYVNETRSQIQLEMGHEWLAFTLALLSVAASSLWK
jgi:hypothetical protein